MRHLIDNLIEAADVKEKAGEFLEGIARHWNKAAQESSIITPDPKFPIPSGDERRQSVVRGWNLFRLPGDAGCIGCHVDYGRQSLLFYDEWGTIGRPTDLTKGVYRGGNRRIDIYWRIYQGVNGSNMPESSRNLATESYRSQNGHDGIWDLVNFLEVLPYKKMRDDMGIRID